MNPHESATAHIFTTEGRVDTDLRKEETQRTQRILAYMLNFSYRLWQGTRSFSALDGVASDFTGLWRLTTLCAMELEDRAITKRQLGVLLALVGIAGFVAILLIDVVDVGRQGGIGPAQRLALALMAATAILGVTLIPRGDAPA